MNRVLTEFPRRHPLVLPAVAWVAGLLTGFGTRPSYDFRCLAVFVGFLPWLLAVFFRRQVGYNVRVTGWLMLVFCLGYWRAGGTLNSAIDPPVDDAEIRLIAVVAGDPEPAGNPREPRGLVTPVSPVGAWREADGTPLNLGGRVYLKLYGRGLPAYNERWEFRNVRLTGNRAGSGPLRATAMLHHAKRLEHDPTGRLGSRLFRVRREAADILAYGVENKPVSVSVVRALLLGYRSGLGNTLQKQFAQTGTLHVFAVSGLHVVMITGLVVQLLRLVCWSRVYWFWGILPLALSYAWMTGMTPSAVRATVMALVFLAAPLVGRRADGACALAAALIGITAADPDQLSAPGLVLSFTVVGGLMALVPVFSAVWRPWLQLDPWVPKAQPNPHPRLRSMVRSILQLVTVSVSAWLVSAPLTAWYFGWLSPVAMMSNLVVVPLVGLIMLAGSLSLVSGLFLLPLAGVFNHINLLLTSVLLRSVRWFHAIPGGGLQVEEFPGWAVLTWYTVLGMGVLAWYTYRRKVCPQMQYGPDFMMT